jgi:DNA polymerase
LNYVDQRFVVIDFETYYSKDYTLSKSSTAEYIRDPRFEVIGVGVMDGPRRYWFSEADFQKWAWDVPWGTISVLAHHTHFDGFILEHHFGVRPAFWLDTLSMARAIHGSNAGGSLKALAEKYGVGQKGDEVVKALGKRRADFTAAEWTQYGNYCLNDCLLTDRLYAEMSKGYPADELEIIDMTVRMFTEPMFELDMGRMRDLVASEKARKLALLQRIHTGASELQSNAKFAELLLVLGAEPPTKISPRTGKTTFAFAKTDPGMAALLEHESEDVRWLAEARVGVKSTINETRAERFLRVGETGAVPVYLKYFGAHTGRWSGGDKMNMQNLVRGGELRNALFAPEGQVVVAADSNAIEARGVAWLAEQNDLVEAFRTGRDPYCEFASEVYQRTISKADVVERQVGKTGILGLGYGMGWAKAAATFAAGPMGAKPVIFTEADLEAMGGSYTCITEDTAKEARVRDMPSRLELGARLTHCAAAHRIVDLYRQKHERIVGLWRRAERLIVSMAEGGGMELGPVAAERHALRLPNGMTLKYPGLAKGDDGFTYLGGSGRSKVPTKVYGGLLVENIVQALARIVVGEQALAAKRLGARIVTLTHDEIVCIVPEKHGPAATKQLCSIMSVTPGWAAGWPLAAEGGYGRSYGEV